MFILVGFYQLGSLPIGTDKLNQLSLIRARIAQLELSVSSLEGALSHKLIFNNWAGFRDDDGNRPGHQLPGGIEIIGGDNEQTVRDALARLRADLGLMRTEEAAVQGQIDEDKKAIRSTQDLQKGG